MPENVVRQSTRTKRYFFALLGMVSENTIQQSTYLKTLVVLLEGVCIIVNPKATLSSVTGRVSENGDLKVHSSKSDPSLITSESFLALVAGHNLEHDCSYDLEIQRL